jgi:acyl-CoA thioesterase FadM
MKGKMLFSNQSPVRIDDLAGYHLSHSRLINIVHNTRAVFLKQHQLSEFNCFGVSLVMLKLNVEYIHECFFDDILEIKMYLSTISKAKLDLSYTIHNLTRNEVAAHAQTLMGFFDQKKNKLTRAPEKFNILLESVFLSKE